MTAQVRTQLSTQQDLPGMSCGHYSHRIVSEGAERGKMTQGTRGEERGDRINQSHRLMVEDL